MNKVLSRLGAGALATTVVLAPLALPSAAFGAPGDPITIPSNGFLNCLISLGVDTDENSIITEGEADAFTGALDCSTDTPWAFPSVNGIGFFQNVTEIDLSGIGIQDLSGFTGGTDGGGLDADNPTAPSLALGALTNLNLSNNPLENLGFLNGFAGLEALNLSENTVLEDLTPLGTMTNLVNLDLSGSVLVEDLTPLTQALESLDISDVPVAWDLTSLDVSALEFLDVSNTLVEDISILSSATALSSFYAEDAVALEDLTGLDSAVLTNLWVNGTAVEDLTVLSPAAIASLVSLNVSNTPLVDLTPLAGATSLSTLWASDTGVEDLSPLNGLGLSALELDRTAVVDLTPLAGQSFSVLSLSGNLLDYDTFAGITVDELDLSETGLSDLSVLVGTGVTILNIADNSVADLFALGALASLSELDFSGNNVLDISPLVDLALLTTVNGADQVVAFADAQATVPFGNTVIGLDGEGLPVVLSDTEIGTYDAVADTWVWTTAGAYSVAWNSTVTLNGSDFVFSGAGNQTVTPFDAETITTGAFEMPWYGYMGIGALALAIAAAFGFVAFRRAQLV